MTIEDGSSSDLKAFFKNHPNIKGSENLLKLHQTIDEIYNSSSDTISLKTYKILGDFIIKEFYTTKPVTKECFFFPGKENEINVINFLRRPKISLDIAIFTLTNDFLYAALEETFKRGVKIRVIADDECMKQFGSDICKLASIGVSVKTDNSVQYHMHHKFAVADKSVILTGSFNWTTQAVFNNQENVLILEDKEIALKYSTEFQKLWNSFKTEVSVEMGKQLLEEQSNNQRNKNY